MYKKKKTQDRNKYNSVLIVYYLFSFTCKTLLFLRHSSISEVTAGVFCWSSNIISITDLLSRFYFSFTTWINPFTFLWPSASCLLDFFFFFFVNEWLNHWLSCAHSASNHCVVLSWMSRSVLPNRPVITDPTECVRNRKSESHGELIVRNVNYKMHLGYYSCPRFSI